VSHEHQNAVILVKGMLIFPALDERVHLVSTAKRSFSLEPLRRLRNFHLGKRAPLPGLTWSTLTAAHKRHYVHSTLLGRNFSFPLF